MYSFGKVDRRSFSFASQDELLHAHKYTHMKQSTGKCKKIILDFSGCFSFWHMECIQKHTQYEMAHAQKITCVHMLYYYG